tara:strand:+ start:462 stop:707 length:246 start_codon:yes stop_codon:yes gene_type:complete
MIPKDLYKVYTGLKYARRRKILKKGQDPLVRIGRVWTKASKKKKAAIVAGIVVPKAAIFGVAYAGSKSGKSASVPKKYMAG